MLAATLNSAPPKIGSTAYCQFQYQHSSKKENIKVKNGCKTLTDIISLFSSVAKGRADPAAQPLPSVAKRQTENIKVNNGCKSSVTKRRADPPAQHKHRLLVSGLHWILPPAAEIVGLPQDARRKICFVNVHQIVTRLVSMKRRQNLISQQILGANNFLICATIS